MSPWCSERAGRPKSGSGSPKQCGAVAEALKQADMVLHDEHESAPHVGAFSFVPLAYPRGRERHRCRTAVRTRPVRPMPAGTTVRGRAARVHGIRTVSRRSALAECAHDGCEPGAIRADLREGLAHHPGAESLGEFHHAARASPGMGRTSRSIFFALARSATRRSYVDCRLSQDCASPPK